MKPANEMTGADMRRLARESGELAEAIEEGTPTPTEHLWTMTKRVKDLASVLCEADARLCLVLNDAVDSRDPVVPWVVTEILALHSGAASLPACSAMSLTRQCIMIGHHDVHDDGDGLRWPADDNEGAVMALCDMLDWLGVSGVSYREGNTVPALQKMIAEWFRDNEEHERAGERAKAADAMDKILAMLKAGDGGGAEGAAEEELRRLRRDVPPEPAPGNDPFKPEEWAPVVLSGPPPTLTPAESDLLAQMGSHVLAPIVARYALPAPVARPCPVCDGDGCAHCRPEDRP